MAAQTIVEERIAPAPAKRQHVPALDGIRGLAVLLVLQFHWSEGLKNLSPAGNFFYGVFRTGWAGVDLFFVLSGFLITGILLDSKPDAHYFRNFYARRFLRLSPPYYGFLLFAWGILPLLLAAVGHRPMMTSEDKW